jgi:prevent-host-death family protein
MNTVSVSEVINDFSGYLERAANEDFTVTNNGKPVAVIHGFAHEEDYFE